MWLFAALYILAAAVYIPLGGNAFNLLKFLGFLIFYIVVVQLVIPLTENAPTSVWQEVASFSRRMLWWQCAAILFFCLLEMVYTFLLFGLLLTLTRYGILFDLGNIVIVLILLVVLPLLVMRLLKVRLSEMGFGRGYRVWTVIVVSCFVPFCVLIIQVSTGRGITNVMGESVRLLLVAGFPEEVFFRGILLTRLIRLSGTKWGVVLSALLFGFVHMALNLSHGGNVAFALAQEMLTQAALGLTIAIIFVRTRNVWAGIVFHTLLDATGL